MSSFWMIFSFFTRPWYSRIAVLFAVQKLFSFPRSRDCMDLYFLLVLVPVLSHLVEEALSCADKFKPVPHSLSVRSRVAGLFCWSWVLYSDRYGSVFVLVHAAIQFDYQHLLKMPFFFSSVYFFLLCQKLGAHRCIYLCLCFQFNLIDQCLFFCQCHACFITISL